MAIHCTFIFAPWQNFSSMILLLLFKSRSSQGKKKPVFYSNLGPRAIFAYQLLYASFVMNLLFSPLVANTHSTVVAFLFLVLCNLLAIFWRLKKISPEKRRSSSLNMHEGLYMRRSSFDQWGRYAKWPYLSTIEIFELITFDLGSPAELAST